MHRSAISANVELLQFPDMIRFKNEAYILCEVWIVSKTLILANVPTTIIGGKCERQVVLPTIMTCGWRKHGVFLPTFPTIMWIAQTWGSLAYVPTIMWIAQTWDSLANVPNTTRNDMSQRSQPTLWRLCRYVRWTEHWVGEPMFIPICSGILQVSHFLIFSFLSQIQSHRKSKTQIIKLPIYNFTNLFITSIFHTVTALHDLHHNTDIDTVWGPILGTFKHYSRYCDSATLSRQNLPVYSCYIFSAL